jgi:virulence-associated protein VapD
MFAIAFDLEVAKVVQHHPAHNPTTAYAGVRRVLEGFGFVWTQGSLYTIEDEDMSVLFRAIMALKSLPWVPLVVRDIRAFRIEQWSDFTATIKGP